MHPELELVKDRIDNFKTMTYRQLLEEQNAARQLLRDICSEDIKLDCRRSLRAISYVLDNGLFKTER